MGKIQRLFSRLRYSAPNANIRKEPPGAETKKPLPKDLYASLDKNADLFSQIFHAPKNKDFILRNLICGNTPCAIIFIDGLVNKTNLEDMILRPMLKLEGFKQRPSKRAEELAAKILPVGSAKLENELNAIVQFVLKGNVAILLDECPYALLCEAQGIPKRGVEHPVAETVVLGPQQAFNESLRVNISLIRSCLKTPDLICEFVDVGDAVPSPIAVMYMENITNPSIVKEVKRRLCGIRKDVILNIGEIEQLIEDKPFAMLPQMILTERPDRAASFLMDGMVVLVADNSSHVIGAPATFLHFMHTSEDSFMRWQFGSFSRLIRILGAMVAMLMPGIYCALLLFHQELLPSELITSLIEGQAMIPFSVTAELLFMTVVFDLINEASLRMPGLLGSTLGIIGALVLGQAAVSAQLISPALIIVVSITGLGTFSVPSYSLSIALRIRRYLFIFSAALFGFVGITLTIIALLFSDCALEGFGVPILSPLAPTSPHNPDTFLRLPIFLQRIVPSAFKPKKKMAAQDPRWLENQEGKP